METVAVILCTYNGEVYLKSQIDSILNQDSILVEIFARDDGSADRTLEILRQYGNRYSNFHLMNDGNTCNKGIKKGFMEALSWAVSYSDNILYFAFSDQDDVWLPSKLIKGIEKIRKSTNKNGALYYSNKTVVDENLNVKYKEKLSACNDFSDFYFVSCAYGCTMIINRKMAALSTQTCSSASHFHDDWIHRLAICLESDIIFDNNSYILYRQHGDNACGSFATEGKSLWHLIKRAFEYILNGKGYERATLATDILNHYGFLISEETKEKMKLVAEYKKSFQNKLRLLRKADISGRAAKERWIWKVKVLLGYF